MPDSLPATSNGNAPVARPRGRPTVYSPEIADVIIEQLADGQTLTSACKAINGNAPRDATVRDWVRDDIDGFAARYARARDIGVDLRADRLIDMVAAVDADPAKVQKARLVADTEKWFLSKLAPKRYGDKLTLAGDPDSPVEVVTDDKALARRAAFLLALGSVEESDT